MRRCAPRLSAAASAGGGPNQVLIQPLHCDGVPFWESDKIRTSRGFAGGQFGMSSSPATNRPFMYEGPDDLPYWHHVADIWRPKQPPTAAVAGHTSALPSLEGPFALTPALVAVRPILRSIIARRNDEAGPANALERWDAVKKGHEAGIFDAPCLHRAGYFVLDVLAEHRDVDAAETVYAELHGPEGPCQLPLDCGHIEKMVWLCYSSESWDKAAQYMAAADDAGAAPLLKTATWAAAMACHGRNLEGGKALDRWDGWVLLAREIASFPPAPLAEAVMGCIEPDEVARAKKALRNFNDFYLEQVWKYCRASGMENDAMIYYVEWLYKSRRHVMLDPGLNIHFMRYAYKRVMDAANK